MKYKYKNVSKNKQALIGFGTVEPNKTIETKRPVNNPKFKLISESKKSEVERAKGK